MSSIYERNYEKLKRLIPDLDDLTYADARKSKSSGYMDLNLDVLDISTKTVKGVGAEDQTFKSIKIALSHYYKDSSGEMVADPDMEIEVWPSRKMAQALTYQDTYGFKMVYPEPGKVYPKLQKELNTFLGTWLTNCINQHHSLKSDLLITSNENGDVLINKHKLSACEYLKTNGFAPVDINIHHRGQLPLAILLEAVPKEVALDRFQKFNADIIAPKQKDEVLSITRTEIKNWFEANCPEYATKAMKKLDGYPNIKEKTNQLMNSR